MTTHQMPMYENKLDLLYLCKRLNDKETFSQMSTDKLLIGQTTSGLMLIGKSQFAKEH
jgi:hypothetical protein